jgi:hypothetical protein
MKPDNGHLSPPDIPSAMEVTDGLHRALRDWDIDKNNDEKLQRVYVYRAAFKVLIDRYDQLSPLGRSLVDLTRANWANCGTPQKSFNHEAKMDRFFSLCPSCRVHARDMMTFTLYLPSGLLATSGHSKVGHIGYSVQFSGS